MDPPHVDRSATNLDVEIRFAGELDADAISLLLGDLGYSIEAARILEKLAALRHSPADRVWVAEAPSGVLGDAGEALAGLLSFHAIPLLHTPGNLGRITSLVVHPQLRGRGIGRRLVGVAEGFARESQCERLELTSGEHRHDAHRFYLALGFALRSARFVKTLARAGECPTPFRAAEPP